MQRFAYVAAGRVAELIELPAEAVLAERFHADPATALLCVPAGPEVRVGWTWDGEAFAPPPPPPLPTHWLVPKMVVVRRMTIAEAAALRALLTTLDAKTQTLWESARELWSDDPDVLAAAQALGWTPARVAELLAPDPAAKK
jgi:hypothetical protein